jgi:hypothetical protein
VLRLGPDLVDQPDRPEELKYLGHVNRVRVPVGSYVLDA